MTPKQLTANGFSHFALGPRIQNGIADMGFVEPRPVQEQTIPAVLEGKDVLGLAETGTGKTAAFALPILHRLMNSKPGGVRALIIAPTRELAMQIDTEIRALAKHTNIRSITIYGGVSMRKQITGLKKNPEIVVACPGRLLDLFRQRVIRLNKVETLVLDEADHLFDMGFLPDIRKILRELPKARQNLMFSATMPSEIRRLADDILREPHLVELNRIGPASTIEHELYPVSQTRKFDLLKHLLSVETVKAAIVFTRTKHRAKRLAMQLARAGEKAVALQGNMTQQQRDQAMGGFRNGRHSILVATDIAARGIDVLKVSHVINFDIPATPEAYTHRLGRTGRAEQAGKACTFVTADDRDAIQAIEGKLGGEIPVQIVEEFGGEAEARWIRPAKKKPGERARKPGGRGRRRAGKVRRRSMW